LGSFVVYFEGPNEVREYYLPPGQANSGCLMGKRRKNLPRFTCTLSIVIS
jgi:hypothetical protein